MEAKYNLKDIIEFRYQGDFYVDRISSICIFAKGPTEYYGALHDEPIKEREIVRLVEREFERECVAWEVPYKVGTSYRFFWDNEQYVRKLRNIIWSFSEVVGNEVRYDLLEGHEESDAEDIICEWPLDKPLGFMANPIKPEKGVRA